MVFPQFLHTAGTASIVTPFARLLTLFCGGVFVGDFMCGCAELVGGVRFDRVMYTAVMRCKPMMIARSPRANLRNVQ